MDYFKHDINASEDDKICELLAQEGYEIIRKYRAAELVTHMINDMERILERR